MNVTTTKVFIPDDEFVWLCAEIRSESLDTGQVEVVIQDDVLNGSIRSVVLKKYGLNSLPFQNTNDDADGVNDMCSLGYLHEASILHNLRRRFEQKLPYTYIGDICIAMNPYFWLDIYSSELRADYARKLRSELPPHIYATSAASYRGLAYRGKNQSILVSGESGAGKTETVKLLMSHCALTASNEGDIVIDKLLKANPLLESFGNAKTSRNDNSSRFGKFSQLEFDNLNHLVGSRCITYLLEKSRVVTQNNAERNYHIFYQLLASPEHISRELHLLGKTCVDFQYCNRGDNITHVIEGISDQDRFHLTSEALTLLGVNELLRIELFKALAGILYLGQVQIVALQGDTDTATISRDSPECAHAVEICANLLGVDVEAFVSAVTCRTIGVEGQRLTVPLTLAQSISGKDALAKEIYARIFQWLVYVINFNTSFNLSSHSKNALVGTISLLDIFGFECFTVNRFEQLCINYANEKLQQKFTQDVFKTVQVEYQDEGLLWDHITYNDNVEILELLEGKRGVIAALNEECIVPRGSDSGLVSKLKSTFNQSNIFGVIQTQREQFTIQHFAGKVAYTVTGFLERNKDTLPEDMRTLLSNSRRKLLSRVFTESNVFSSHSSEQEDIFASANSALNERLLLLVEDDGGGYRSPASLMPQSGASTAADPKTKRSSFVTAETVTMKFKTQLSRLMEVISATEVQYVRCIKPNANKSAVEFSRQLVVEQLRTAGMIQAIQISRSAYPNRLSYPQFVARFRCMRPRRWHEDLEARMPKVAASATHAEHDALVEVRYRQIAAALIESILTDWHERPVLMNDEIAIRYSQFGKTKVYFSSIFSERMEERRTKVLYNFAIDIQRVARSRPIRRYFLLIRRASVKVQTFWRAQSQRNRYLKMKSSTILLQCAMRVFRARRVVKQLRIFRAASKIQAIVRRNKQQRQFKAMKYVATVATSIAKMKSQRKRYIILRDLHRVIKELKSRLSDILDELNVEKENHLQSITRFERLLVEDKELLENEQRKVLELAESLRQTEQRLQLTEDELSAAHRTIEQKLVDLEEMRMKCDRGNQLIQELQEKYESLEGEMKRQNAESEADKKNLQDRLDQVSELHECSVRDFEGRVSSLEGEIQEFQGKVLSLEVKLDEEREMRSQEESKGQMLLEQLEESTRVWEGEKMSLTESLEELNLRLGELQNQYELKVAQLNDYEGQLETSQIAIRDYQARGEELEGELMRRNKEIAVLKSNSQSDQERLIQSENSMSELRRLLEEMTNENSRLRAELESKDEQILALNEEVAQVGGELNLLSTENEALRKSNAELEDALITVSISEKNLLEENEQLSDSFERIKFSFEEVTAALDESVENNANLLRRVQEMQRSFEEEIRLRDSSLEDQLQVSEQLISENNLLLDQLRDYNQTLEENSLKLSSPEGEGTSTQDGSGKSPDLQVIFNERVQQLEIELDEERKLRGLLEGRMGLLLQVIENLRSGQEEEVQTPQAVHGGVVEVSDENPIEGEETLDEIGIDEESLIEVGIDGLEEDLDGGHEEELQEVELLVETNEFEEFEHVEGDDDISDTEDRNIRSLLIELGRKISSQEEELRLTQMDRNELIGQLEEIVEILKESKLVLSLNAKQFDQFNSLQRTMSDELLAANHRAEELERELSAEKERVVSLCGEVFELSEIVQEQQSDNGRILELQLELDAARKEIEALQNSFSRLTPSGSQLQISVSSPSSTASSSVSSSIVAEQSSSPNSYPPEKVKSEFFDLASQHPSTLSASSASSVQQVLDDAVVTVLPVQSDISVDSTNLSPESHQSEASFEPPVVQSTNPTPDPDSDPAPVPAPVSAPVSAPVPAPVPVTARTPAPRKLPLNAADDSISASTPQRPKSLTSQMRRASTGNLLSTQLRPIRDQFETIFYLSAKSGSVIEKNAVVRRISNGLNPVDFECELIGGKDTAPSRLKFSSTDIRDVKIGKGITITITTQGRFFMNINIRGKGELNMSFSSEAERDEAIRLLRFHESSSSPPSSHEMMVLDTSQLPSPTSVGGGGVGAGEAAGGAGGGGGNGIAPPSLRSPFVSPDQSLPRTNNKRFVPQVNIVKKGWVTKEGTKDSSDGNKIWTRRYLLLERETRLLKYAATEAVLQFPSQVIGQLKITSTMSCSSYKSRDGSFIVEMCNTQDGKIQLRVKVDSVGDQLNWSTSIRSVIADCLSDDVATVPKVALDISRA